LFVEDFVEQDDLASDFVVAESLEFVEGVDGTTSAVRPWRGVEVCCLRR